MHKIYNDPPKQIKLVAIAEAMLTGTLNLIEGSRQISDLCATMKDSENEIFLPFRAVESETDHFPIGAMRSLCSETYLQKMDVEMNAYLSDAKEEIFEACHELIKFYEG